MSGAVFNTFKQCLLMRGAKVSLLMSPSNTFKHVVLQQASNVCNGRSHDTVREPVSGSSVSVNSVSSGLSQTPMAGVLDQAAVKSWTSQVSHGFTAF